MFKSTGTIDPNVEKRILTSMIVSDRIASDLVPITDRELFRLSIAKTVFSWVQDFVKVYNKAPKTHIQDIFDSNKAHINQIERVEIEEFLSTLSKEFANAEWANEDYLLSESKKYLRKRHILHTAEQMTFLAESDLLDEAEACIKVYDGMIDTGISGWRKPFDDKKFIGEVFNRKGEDTLFNMGGALDTLFGPLRKSWLMLLLGPMKRGKTWGLQEIAMSALLNNRRVAFFSLEMEDTDIAGRFYQGLSSSPEEDTDIQYPIFDCVLNQRNSCNDPRRINQVPRPPTYISKHPYQVCTLCRYTDPKSFKPTIWYFTEKRKSLTFKTTTRKIESMLAHIHPNLFRLKSYPIGSANVKTMDKDLNSLYRATGWSPHVIVDDYADITAPEEKGQTGRDKENATWIAHKWMAQKWKALVATGSQGNRGSFDVDSMEEKNTSEDIRKLAHIDIAATINQTELEKLDGCSRIGVLNHRWKTFHKTHQAMILQQLEAGQFHLDSLITIDEAKQEKFRRLKRI